MIKLSSFQLLVLQNYIYGIFGVLSGLIINTISVIIMKILHLKSNEILFRILIQLLLCSVTLGIFEKILLKDLAFHWKTITPGFIFFALFFGMQLELYLEASMLFREIIHLNLLKIFF